MLKHFKLYTDWVRLGSIQFDFRTFDWLCRELYLLIYLFHQAEILPNEYKTLTLKILFWSCDVSRSYNGKSENWWWILIVMINKWAFSM